MIMLFCEESKEWNKLPPVRAKAFQQLILHTHIKDFPSTSHYAAQLAFIVLTSLQHLWVTLNYVYMVHIYMYTVASTHTHTQVHHWAMNFIISLLHRRDGRTNKQEG